MTLSTVETAAASSCLQRLHSSTDTLTYTVSLTITKFGEQAYAVGSPSVWNSLPSDIWHIADTAIVKRHLKTHVF